MASTPPPSLDDERLTTVGLLFESAAGLRRLFLNQRETMVSTPGSPPIHSFDILIRLARSEGGQLRMSELASQASLTPSGLTRAVDRLERQGLVERHVCPEDRRGSFAHLTPAGQDLMAATLPDHIAQVESVLDELFTPEEEAQFTSTLRRIRDYALEQNTASSGTCDLADGPTAS